MSTEIRQSELRNDNAAIMRRVADVVPHQRDTGRCRFVPADEFAAMTETSPLGEEGAQQWLRDVREGSGEEPEGPWTRQAQKCQQGSGR